MGPSSLRVDESLRERVKVSASKRMLVATKKASRQEAFCKLAELVARR